MARTDRVVLMVGTRKGGYLLRSDTSRRHWKIGPCIADGSDVYHVTADPRHPGEFYALANNDFWGPMVLRSTDGGDRWREAPTPRLPRRSQRTPGMAEGGESSPARSVRNLWHLTPGPADRPGTLFLGADPHLLFRSDDHGRSWAEVPGLTEHPTRDRWNPGAGGPCVHTILLDPAHPGRLYVGISAAGTFRSDDLGESFRPVNRGVRADFQPDRYPEVGQCVHKIALDPRDPQTIYRQDHCGMYVSRDGMDDGWTDIGRGLPSRFGFGVATAPALPGRAFFLPLDPQSRTTLGDGLQIYQYTDRDHRWRPLIRGNPFPGRHAIHREGLAADRLDPAGIYLGTTTGRIVWSADGGRDWTMLPLQFPAIHSVEAFVEGPNR